VPRPLTALRRPRDRAADGDVPPLALEGIELRVDRRGSVADQVHAALRAAIIDIRLPPGAPISENSICRQFGISRTPVRAAIQRLSEEGLVDVYPQLGSFVAPIRLAGLQDSHFVRRSVELALVREAADAWTDAAADSLGAILAEQEAAVAAGDADAFHLADERFHAEIARIAGRESVWPMVLAAKLPLTRFIRFTGNARRLPEVIEEHRRVLDALRRRDGAAAEAALADHLDKIFVIYAGLPEEDRRVIAS
jgi:DNA-binding GntR family transcriptional regulator